jgi:4-hydroxy-tetrahydrodipicolinate reductase
MSKSIPVAVHGAAGRMGRAVVDVLRTRDDLHLVAALVRSGTAAATSSKHDASDVVCSEALPSEIAAAVLIDFSGAGAFDRVLELALERRIALVSGTTGLDARQRAAIERASSDIPLLWSANFSLGVALLSKLVADAARALPQWDCEIAEAHHRYKQDAPSGTALALGREVAAARGVDFESVAKRSRIGEHVPRADGEIGFAVTRAADIVGEHRVLFATAGECIELSHRASDRAIFARGAVAAARWIAGRAPGLYRIGDVVAAEPQ